MKTQEVHQNLSLKNQWTQSTALVRDDGESEKAVIVREPISPSLQDIWHYLKLRFLGTCFICFYLLVSNTLKCWETKIFGGWGTRYETCYDRWQRTDLVLVCNHEEACFWKVWLVGRRFTIPVVCKVLNWPLWIWWRIFLIPDWVVLRWEINF